MTATPSSVRRPRAGAGIRRRVRRGLLNTAALLVALVTLFPILWIVTYFFNRGGADWGTIMAAPALYTIPPVCFFLLVQRHLAKGLLAGAVKE